MLFDDKKLTPEAIDDLLQCSIESVAPYTLMLAPVYVFMKLNKKFISVKAPLDFFLPEELERLKEYEVFYMPKFVRHSARFQTAARLVKNLLLSEAKNKNALDITPYEISNESLKVMATLWGKEMQIEPFFMGVFTHELCRPLNRETIVWAREQAVVRHDLGLLLSGAFVFLVIHLGVFDYETLNRLRDEIYEKTVAGEEWKTPKNIYDSIASSIDRYMLVNHAFHMVGLSQIQQEWSQKLLSRLKRIQDDFSRYSQKSPTIFGEDGFVA